MSTSLSSLPGLGSSGPPSFAATRWSLVAAAGQRGGNSVAQRALGELCELYWRPLFGYVRRRGYGRAEAEDLTQGFFARLLAGEPFAEVAPDKGRFRSYLLASVQHFLANEWDRAHAQKRGGGKTILSLDALTAEARDALAPAAGDSPEQAYDRLWAQTVIEAVLARLRAEFATPEQRARFEVLKPFLAGDAAAVAAAAQHSGMSEGALKVAVHRLRRRYRELLRAEIAHTVRTPAEVDAELCVLIAALR